MANTADILHRIAARLGLEVTELRPYSDAMLEICETALDGGGCVELMTFGTVCPTPDGLHFRAHASLLPLAIQTHAAELPIDSRATSLSRDALIDALAARRNIPRHSAQVFLHACFDVVKSLLREGHDIALPGIGRWTPILGEDGILAGMDLSALRPEESLFEMTEGTAAHSDTRHFIPAIALNPYHPRDRTPVDIGAIVTELRRVLGIEPVTVHGIESVTARGGAEHAMAVQTPAVTALEDPAYSADTLTMDEVHRLELEIKAERDWDPEAAADTHTDDAEDLALAEAADDAEDLALVEAADDAEDLALVEAADDAEDPTAGDAMPDVWTGVSDPDILDEPDAPADPVPDATDPLSDTDVFHRNRDQLYHPPEETGRRPLLVTAAILTFCVLVIIIYMLLDQSEPRELPGSDPIGQLVIRPMRADAP